MSLRKVINGTGIFLAVCVTALICLMMFSGRAWKRDPLSMFVFTTLFVTAAILPIFVGTKLLAWGADRVFAPDASLPADPPDLK